VYSWILASSAPAIELWVALDGNDINAGSSNQPFATIARAQQKAREFREPGM